MKTKYTNVSVLSEYPATLPDSRELDMLSIADAFAKSSNCTPHKMGAVIFRRNKIVARGYNRLGNHPFQFRWNKKGGTLHAEMHALLSASKEFENVEGASIAVVRRTKRKTNGCSFPCNQCLPALKYAGIFNVICFSDNDIPVKVRLQCD